MSLFRVTITGADDAVDPADLLALSLEFPFVEWGILFSLNRQGTARYPSPDFLAALTRANDHGSMSLSLHTCGAATRRIHGGEDADRLRSLFFHGFRRAQLNGIMMMYVDAFGRRALGATADALPDLEVIVQAAGESMLVPAAEVARALPNASVLFDPSGGRGIEPFSWPRVPLGVRFGFAGGITPENVAQVIGEIGVAQTGAEPFWIDMESGVRTDDCFDLAKVRAVLEAAAQFVDGGAR